LKLCRAAYDTVCDVFKLEIDGDSGVPAMVGAVQTFGDFIHWHSHIHAIVPEGVFTESGFFVHIPDKGEHQIRYYGFYSNKSRGMREKDNKPVAAPGQPEPDTPFRRKCRMTPVVSLPNHGLR
jgi:hypothetical protein